MLYNITGFMQIFIIILLLFKIFLFRNDRHGTKPLSQKDAAVGIVAPVG
jgi:hypothetical protein